MEHNRNFNPFTFNSVLHSLLKELPAYVQQVSRGLEQRGYQDGYTYAKDKVARIKLIRQVAKDDESLWAILWNDHTYFDKAALETMPVWKELHDSRSYRQGWMQGAKECYEQTIIKKQN